MLACFLAFASLSPVPIPSGPDGVGYVFALLPYSYPTVCGLTLPHPEV